MAKLKQVFLFQSHIRTAAILREYRMFRKAVKDLGDVFFLYHSRSGITPPLLTNEDVYPISDESIFLLNYPMIGERLIPGHAHFVLLRFFLENPEYKYYWVIEYDVRYSGKWQFFFNTFQDSTSDLITCHIRNFQDEPEWPWWTLEHPLKSVPTHERIRSFNTVYRLSCRSLSFVHNALRDGWKGHHEVLIPTLLYRNEFSITDMGGKGAFTPPGMENQFYIGAESNSFGTLTSGTMRYRPAFLSTGRMKNKLYHPVKPLPFIVRERISCLRSLCWRLLSGPMQFKKPSRNVR